MREQFGLQPVCVDQEKRALNSFSVGSVDGKYGRCGECSREED